MNLNPLAWISIALLALAPSAFGAAQKGKKSGGRELATLYGEDVSDRSDRGRFSDKEIVERRRKRVERLDEILRAADFTAGEDFYYAGRLLAREGEEVNRILLGHVLLSIAALQRASYALEAGAESLDRWLLATGRSQQLCSVLDGEDARSPPTKPFDNHVHQSIRAEFALEPLHFDDQRAEPRGKKPKGFNSKEVQRLDTSLNGDPKSIRPVDPDAALVRVRAIVGEGGLVDARDYFAAARVLMRGAQVQDLALAHALALLAAAEGATDARELAATTLDALLRACGTPEAFGSVVTAASEAHAFDAWGPALDTLLRKSFGLPQPNREAGGVDRKDEE
ncbi:MAG: hypothetical protein K8S98_14340 [Planctomycetes bacterium]|nr:hypothetical protein [Planctomycetota bacterium]